MSDPYTIHIFVPYGDPEGTKIVELFGWTGVGIAFPRSGWPQVRGLKQFDNSGVYILIGPTEGTDDELPTVYVGQGDEIRVRIDSHHVNKLFWDWGYAFVSNGHDLNRAHITWLEHVLLELAKRAGRCHLDNANHPKEPRLSEAERADINGFLREMLRILPLLGVRVFEKPAAVAIPAATSSSAPIATPVDDRDTVVVPAREPGFTETFLGDNSWYAIRIGGGMLEKIQYIAAYQSLPVAAVTYYAPVDHIESYGNDGKYRLVFSEPAKLLPQPIPWADAPLGLMLSPRYTSLAVLLSAKKVTDLFAPWKATSET